MLLDCVSGESLFCSGVNPEGAAIGMDVGIYEVQKLCEQPGALLPE
jgi:hypothetical protein